MKISDILNEDATCSVARFYKEASKKSDKFMNPENVRYKEKNAKYYDDHFKQWFDEEVVPVFTNPIDKPQPEYNILPKDGKLQSPGYRGLQYALAGAGLPYNHNVQRYEPNASIMIASQTMDSIRNNNGQ